MSLYQVEVERSAFPSLSEEKRIWYSSRKSLDFHNAVLRVAYCSYRLLSALGRLITPLLLLLCCSTTIQCMCKTFEEGRLAVIMAPDRAIDYVLELKSKALFFFCGKET